VPIHAHVLSTCQVLFWGRRNPPGTSDFDSLNQHECSTFIWDPSHSQLSRPTGNRPTDAQGAPINLFCSGHTFLPDGRLLVTGGHLFDGQGIDCATIYDPATDCVTTILEGGCNVKLTSIDRTFSGTSATLVVGVCVSATKVMLFHENMRIDKHRVNRLHRALARRTF
jgi:hypothetical protein